jgi:2-methylisocitrate lyase-like PEP mutase family enzyme
MHVNPFSKLFNSGHFVVALGTHDPLTARLIERTGFDAVIVGGYATAGSLLGMPDIDLVGFEAMLRRVRAVANVTSLPIYADGDTGYGGIPNLLYTVQEYENAGAAMIQLEDQVMPKRCGHMAGKEVVSRQEWVARIRAAVDARKDMLIAARTDAIQAVSLDEALWRGKAARDLGADVIFIEAISTQKDMERVNRDLDAPTIINQVEGGVTPLLPHTTLEDLGFNMVIHPCLVTYRIAYAVANLLKGFREAGDSTPFLQEIMQFPEYNDLVGLTSIRQKEQSYRS